MSQFDASRFRRHHEVYQKDWRILDDTLYTICRDYPDHRRRDAVVAKLWIIGRAYATGIERQIKSTGGQGSSLFKLIEHFWKNSEHIDKLFGELGQIREPLLPDSLIQIAQIHGQFLQLLRGVVRKRETPRSFASKYMHFHYPVVPIYDSVAATELRRHVRWTRGLELFALPTAADPEYAWYLMRFHRLYVEAQRCDAKVKHVDHYLLSCAGERVA